MTQGNKLDNNTPVNFPRVNPRESEGKRHSVDAGITGTGRMDEEPSGGKQSISYKNIPDGSRSSNSNKNGGR